MRYTILFILVLITAGCIEENNSFKQVSKSSKGTEENATVNRYTDKEVLGPPLIQLSEKSNIVKIQSRSEFDQLIRNSSKPLLVDFYADWCRPCKGAAVILEKLSKDRKNDFILVKVDVDRHQELARDYSIRSIPAVFGITGGVVAAKKIGLGSYDDYSEMINSLR